MEQRRVRGGGFIGLVVVAAIILVLAYLSLRQMKSNPVLKPATGQAGQGFQPKALQQQLEQQTQPRADVDPEKQSQP